MRWVLDELATRWGVPVALHVGPPRPDLAVDAAHVAVGRPVEADAVHLPLDEAAYLRSALGQPSGPPEDRTWRTSGAADAIAAVFRLLNLLDEEHVDPAARNALGVFDTDALPAGRRAVAGAAIVEHEADRLWSSIGPRRPDLVPVDRWPGGARAAVVISHDTDAVAAAAVAELAFNGAKALLRGDDRARRLVGAGLRARGQLDRDPLHRFGHWEAWEHERGLRSTFFVHVRPPGTPRHVHDARSDVLGVDEDWAARRRAVDAGWELGVHPSIHTARTPGALAAARQAVQERLERPVVGLRHHYFALDWHRPDRTFVDHAAAGYRYDASIAWRDRAGFRAGTCLPYRVLDQDRRRPLDLVELPLAVMDTHLTTAAAPALARATAGDVLDEVVRRGGVAVLDWHTEYFTAGARGIDHPALLLELVGPLLERQDIWFATAAELCDHWRARAEVLCGPWRSVPAG